MRLTKKEMERLLHQHKNAPLWKRVIAFLIDILLLELLILAPLQSIITSRIPTPDSFSNIILIAESLQPYQGLLIMTSILMAVLSYAYFVLLEGLTQQTLGKALMNITVTSNGKKPTWGQILGRNITKALTTTSLSILFLADVIYLLIKKKQRFTEKLSNTEVYNS